MIIGKPEFRTRAKRRVRAAISILEYRGNLELVASDEGIALFGENNEVFHEEKVYDICMLRKDDGLDIVKDLIYVAEKSGYSPSLLDRVLLNVGYVPGTIPLTRN